MLDELEPSANLENRQLKQEVYEEMKNNNITTDHLIEILQVDEDNLPDTLGVEVPAGEHDDIVTQYTMKSIGSCQDTNFLFLLLKNFARGKHSSIIDEVVSKVDKQFSKQSAIIRQLNLRVAQLQEENLEQRLKIKQLSDESEKDKLIKQLQEQLKQKTSSPDDQLGESDNEGCLPSQTTVGRARKQSYLVTPVLQVKSMQLLNDESLSNSMRSRLNTEQNHATTNLEGPIQTKIVL